jgi:hypothetical protein
MALSKQHCLSGQNIINLIVDTELASCVAWASFKTGAPKLSASLDFSLITFFVSRQRK